MIILLGLIGWILCAIAGLIIWAREFDEVPLIIFIMAVVSGPCFLFAGMIASPKANIVVWKRKKKDPA